MVSCTTDAADLHFCLTDPVPMYHSEPFAWEVSLLLAGSVDAGPDTFFGYSAGVHPDCTHTLQLVGAELSTPGSGSGSKPLPTAGAGEARLHGVSSRPGCSSALARPASAIA